MTNTLATDIDADADITALFTGRAAPDLEAAETAPLPFWPLSGWT